MPEKNALEFCFGGKSGVRLDRALAELIPSNSRSFLQKLVRDGRVTVDGEICLLPRRALDGGEKIVVEIPEAPDTTPRAEKFDYPILFEDDSMLVINKPAGAVVHPGAGNPAGTVVNALLGRYPEMTTRFDCRDSRPGIVHRLDKDTSGVLVIAKTPEAQFKLSRSFAERETTKTYLALVRGIPEKRTREISAPIGRHPINRQKMAVVERNGKPALSRYTVKKTGMIGIFPVALLEVGIATGRTHQIRVHMASIGHPVLGDTLYGGTRSAAAGIDRQMLHAWKLTIPHPVTGEMLTFCAPIPADMEKWTAILNG
ncbi:MAG: RluA family pseudouridine synthase [Victivallaceae bacterium]|nr:RluA family pseudouridine synthase [Victivallaceae bacterium]